MTLYQKNSHCSYCGAVFAPAQPWPRRCARCQKTSFINPLPVAVVLLPVDGGIVTIRRDIEPRKGELALPGGYIDLGESWQEACARELFEETGIPIDPAEVTEFRVLSAPDSTVLIFGLARARTRAELPSFEASAETSELVILTEPGELAFPLHTQVVREFFAREAKSPA